MKSLGVSFCGKHKKPSITLSTVSPRRLLTVLCWQSYPVANGLEAF